jgi:hypothetical protein
MTGYSKWSEIQREKRRERAIQACRRMIARGERPLFRPRLEPDGGAILIRIPELDGVTQARHPGEVQYMARDLIAVTLDVPPESFDVAVHNPHK